VLSIRLLTAMVILPAFLSLLIFGSKNSVFVFCFLCMEISLFEFSRMLQAASQPLLNGVGKAVNVYLQMLIMLLGAGLFASVTVVKNGYEHVSIITFFFFGIICGMLLGKNIESSIKNVTHILLSLSYLVIPWVVIWELYELKSSGMYLIFLFSVVALSDTGAYFSGKFFGRIKLSPVLSPNKTWEGALGGLAAAMIGGSFIGYSMSLFSNSWPVLVFVSFVCSVAGILGDLVESLFKRYSNVKDSGKIFPGHGGFLDRVDSAIFAAPALYLAVILFTKF